MLLEIVWRTIMKYLRKKQLCRNSLDISGNGVIISPIGLSMKRTVLFSWLLMFFATNSRADIIISDFHTLNPLIFAYPGSTWATPVNQFESYTDTSGFGQEVLPIAGGNPTVSGGAGHLGLHLNLTGAISLQLTARLLLANHATAIQVLLDDADGTILRFNYPTTVFNTVTFSSAVVAFNNATVAAAGSTPGFNLSDVTVFEVQGNFFDPGGSANATFDAQFHNLATIGSTPEPGTVWLSGVGLLIAGYFAASRHRLASRSQHWRPVSSVVGSIPT